MELGPFGIWTATFEAHPADEARRAVVLLEDLGYPTVWLNETTGREPFAMAGILLAATETLNVAIGIANVHGRDALAMSAAHKTLAEAYPERFLLGLGVSSPVLVEKVRGHSFGKPLTYMREYLQRMDAAPYNAVPPADSPPRVLGALGPKMLRLSSELADGAHPYLTTPEHTRMAREIVGPSALLAPEQMVVLDDDPQSARRTARASLRFYLRAPGYLGNLRRLGFNDDDWADPSAPSDRLVDALVVWGSIDQVVERIHAHHEAGADHVAVQVLRHDQAIPVDEWRALAPALLT